MSTTPKTDNAQTKVLSASLASASSLVLLGLISRVFTFALNQALVRLATPQTYGTASIQFELLVSTILFTREGVRIALLRRPTAGQSTTTKDILVSNVALLPTLLGIPAAFAIAFGYVATSSDATTSQPHFFTSVFIIALATAVELLAEPMYIQALNELRYDIRVRAEGTATLMKTLTTFLFLAFAPLEWALPAFALGQLAWGVSIYSTFLWVYGGTLHFLPEKVTVEIHENKKTMYFDSDFLRLSGAMTGQSIVKHFLNEGDKFLVSRLSPLADQGGYAIASNYGSLAARIVFAPIEDTARLFFSKTLPSSKDDKVVKEADRQALATASQVLLTLLLLFTHLLLLLAVFGPPYLPLGITLFLPSRYHQTSAPQILGAYIYYIPTMAFNGVLEAFFASACTPSDLRAQTRWMIAFSLGFVAAAVTFARTLGFGDAGLVWANIANSCMRALYCWSFIKSYFSARGAREMVSWRRAVPPLPVLGVFAACAAITRWSQMLYQGVPLSILAQKGHIGVAVVCVGCCLVACFVYERANFAYILSVLRKK